MNRRKIGQAFRRLEHLPGGADFFRYGLNKAAHFYHKATRSTKVAWPSTLMLEVTNHPSYFESDAYHLMKAHFWDKLLEIIEEGVANGELRDDISPKRVRQIVLGSIEHLFLSRIIFNREMMVDDIAEDLCDVLFRGIEK